MNEMVKKSLRVLICGIKYPFVYGGSEILIESLQDELKRRGHIVDIVTMPFRTLPLDQIIKNCLSWRFVDFRRFDEGFVDLLIATKFPSYFAKHPNKVVWLQHQLRQSYDLRDSSIGIKGSTEAEEFNKWIKDMDFEVVSEAKKIFAISKNVSYRLKKYNNLDSKVLYPPPKLLGKYRNDDYDDYILYVGRLNDLKRIDLLIGSMRFVKNNLKCLIVGEGIIKDKLMKLVKEYNLREKVEFLGFVDDAKLLDLYANCLCVFFAPLDEDYGFITIEAFNSEKPVITLPDSGGVLEFVKHEKNGFILSDNPKEIADVFDYLYKNKDKAKRLGSEGKKTVEFITWDYVIDNLLSVIER
jgi:glycosyltransferase involved in cell wall biosynthesis